MLVALTIGSCATARPAYIDRDLQPYVDEFSAQFGQRVDWVETKFKDQEGDVVGICRTNDDGAFVEIDPEYWWDEADAGEREALIMHEFGHCVLDRDHVDGIIVDEGESIPKSVMGTFTFSGHTYLKHKPYYMKELFNR